MQHQDYVCDGKLTKSCKGDAEKTNHYKDVKNFYDPFKLIPSDSFTDEKCVCTFTIYITSIKLFTPNFYFTSEKCICKCKLRIISKYQRRL